MIHDLDKTLEALLRDRVPLRTELIAFDVPDDAFRARLSRAGLTANLYLYDIRENHELREPDWKMERQPDGRMTRHRPRVRIDLFYLVTAWSPAEPPDVLAEHALLGRLLRTLMRYGTIPPEMLRGSLVGQESPLPAFTAQPTGIGSPGEFWAALRQPPRPAVHLLVTIAVDPSALTDLPLNLTPVVSRDLGFGIGGGLAYQLTVRPPVPFRYETGARLQRMSIESAVAARLQQAVFASRTVLRVSQVSGLVSQGWVLLDDGASAEFVRLGTVSSSAALDVPVTTPLRFAHAIGVPVRLATAPDPDVITTNLLARANAGVTTLQVADRQRLTVNDVLLLSDVERTEVVQVVAAPGNGNGPITIRPALLYAHEADRNLYRRILQSAAGTLTQPAAQPGSPIVLDAAVGAGVMLMVGTGPNAEFCRLQAAATIGVPVAVVPPLRGNQAATTPLRRAAVTELAGQLQSPAPAESAAVVLAGAPAAVEAARRAERPFLSAGEALQLDDPRTPSLAPVAFQVVAVAETPTAIAGSPEEFFAIGGQVTDNAASPNPLVGAQVTLTEAGLTATTEADGRFTFANVARRNYTLSVTATGYQARTKAVAVPAATVNEYVVALSPV